MKTFSICLFALVCVAQGAWAQTTVNNETELRAAIADGANIVLGDDMTLGNYLSIGNGQTVTIDLNGKTLQRSLTASDDYGSVIRVATGGVLTVKDSSTDNSGKISGGRSSNGGGINNHGVLTLEGGTITGCQASSAGGGVFNAPTTENGTPATFYMTGGAIANCTADEGGGVYNYTGSTTSISGGNISNNTASTHGGGIENNGTLNMSGSPVVKNNTVGGNLSNLVMARPAPINVTGTFTNAAEIFMTPYATGALTAGYGIHHDVTGTNTVFHLDIKGTICLDDGEISYATGEYITDVMVICSSKFDDKTTIWDKYESKGWTIIKKDLNEGAGGLYIYLIYKTVSSKDNSGVPITDFYLKVAEDEDHPATLQHQNRTYTLTPAGDYESFINHGGDLSEEAGGKYIYLYYTKDEFPFPNRAVTNITFNSNPAGAVCSNGGTDACDINENAGGEYIYMHFTTEATEHTVKQQATYLDLNGNTQTVIATVINRLHETLNTGWYVLNGNVIDNFRMNVNGTVNIILSDGKAMTNTKGISVYGGNSLTFWAQSNGEGAGAWTVNSPDHLCAGIGSAGQKAAGSITINGGNITVKGGTQAAGIGGTLFYPGYVTINGGTVNATGSASGPGIGGGYYIGENNTGSVIITGGTVHATGGENGAGIGGGPNADCSVTITGGNITAFGGTNAPGIGDGERQFTGSQHQFNSTITLDYTNNVSIYSTGYVGTVTLKKGFFDTEGIYYAPGTMSNLSQKDAMPPVDKLDISGKRLTPLPLVNLSDNADNATTLASNGSKVRNVKLDERTLYTDGDWNTLCLPFALTTFSGTPLEGATVKTLTAATLDDGTLALYFSDDLTQTEAGQPYIVKWDVRNIGSAAEWDAFAASVNSGTTYEGKRVCLTTDIDISTMAGTETAPFKGIFDGQGHTLTFTKTAEEPFCAPFRYVNGATIRNLHVAGTITTSHQCAAGLIGQATGSTAISNCRNTVTINSTVNGDGTHGGFIAIISSGNTTITDCLFDGTLSGGGTYKCGGFVGWAEGNNAAILIISNCLFKPAEVTLAGGCATFARQRDEIVSVFINHSYYTTALEKVQGIGTSATGSDLVQLLGSGWNVVEASPSGTQHTELSNAVPKIIAGIFEPLFNDVTIEATTPTGITPEGGHVTFTGTYKPVTIGSDGDNTKLYIGAGNTLYWPNAEMNIGCQRAYFQLNGITAGNPASDVRAFVIRFAEDPLTEGSSLGEEETAIRSFDNGEEPIGKEADAWYCLDGRKIGSTGRVPARLPKGVYIHQGKKVVMK